MSAGAEPHFSSIGPLAPALPTRESQAIFFPCQASRFLICLKSRVSTSLACFGQRWTCRFSGNNQVHEHMRLLP